MLCYYQIESKLHFNLVISYSVFIQFVLTITASLLAIIKSEAKKAKDVATESLNRSDITTTKYLHDTDTS